MPRYHLKEKNDRSSNARWSEWQGDKVYGQSESEGSSDRKEDRNSKPNQATEQQKKTTKQKMEARYSKKNHYKKQLSERMENEFRRAEKQIVKSEHVPSQKEVVITPRSSKNLFSSSATTAPTSVVLSWPWGGKDSEKAHPAKLVADLVVMDFIRAYPDVLEVETTSSTSARFGSSGFVGYLLLVLLKHIERTGKLYGSQKFTLTAAPDNLMVPKAWARYISYLGKCKYEGSELCFQYEYDTALTWTNADVLATTGQAVASGWPYFPSSSCGYNIHSKHENATGIEFSYDPSTTGIKTMADVIKYSDLISAKIASTGMCVPLGSIPMYAPDCSAYASTSWWVDASATGSRTIFSQSSWYTAKFDADMAAILKGNEALGFFPITKSMTMSHAVYPQLTDSSDFSYIRGGVPITANSFVFVANRMKNPFSRWNYNGNRLETFVAKYARFDGASIATAVMSSIVTFTEIMKSLGSSPEYLLMEEAESIIVSHYGAWYYRLSMTKPLLLDLANSRWLPSKLYSTAKLFPLVAQLIEDIGPVVNNGTLLLPYPNQRENAGTAFSLTQYSIMDAWNFMQGNSGNAVTYNAFLGGIWNGCGVETDKLTDDWVIGGTTIDNTWTTANVTRPAFPERTMNELFTPQRGVVSKLNMGDAMVVPNYGPIGTCVNQIVTLQDYESFVDPNQISTDGTDYINWNIWRACSRLDSPIPLGKKDLMMAQLMNPRALFATITGGSYGSGYPHSLKFDGHTSDFIESLGAINQTAMQPGGSYVLALGDLRADMKTGSVNVGSLEVDLSRKEECRSYWCKLFGTLLDAGSSYLAGKGESYLIPSVIKEIEDHASKFVYQYTGDLGVVAAKAVMKGVGVALETGLI